MNRHWAMGLWRSGRVVPLYGWRVCFLSKTIHRISRKPSSISATFLCARNTFRKRDKRGEDGAANGLDGKRASVAEVVNVNRRCLRRNVQELRVKQSAEYEWRLER